MDLGIVVMLYKESGEIYSTDEWTNKDVTVTAKYGENLTQNRKMTCTGINKIDYEKT